MNRKNHKNKNILFGSILGTISSYLIFMFIFTFLSNRNIEGAILAGTVTISVIICYCTERLIESMKNSKT